MRLSAKQVKRMEKKNKKLAALLEVVKLNDNDRVIAASNHTQKDNEPMDVEDSFREPSTHCAPCRKRPKININIQHGDSNEKNEDIKTFEENNIAEKSLELEEMDGGEYSDVPNSCPKHEVSIGDNHSICNSENHDSSMKKKKISETYTELKTQLRERRSYSKNNPSLRLKTIGEFASLSVKEKKRTPLLISDIQHVLMYALMGMQAPVWPLRWCVLEKYNRLTHVVVLLAEGVSLYDFMSHTSLFKFINSTFENKLEVIMPCSYKGSLVEELISIPLTGIYKDKLILQYGSLEAANTVSGDVNKGLRAFFPFKPLEEQKEVPLPPSDQFSRTKLLLSVAQLMEQNYPIPMKGGIRNRFSDFLFTKDFYTNVTAVSPMFGLDCEMCRTTAGELEVTRISIVDEKLEVVYESFVKPHNKITDYLTRYSGITKKTLAKVTIRLENVQQDLIKLLPPDAILVGQSLNADLLSLKMMHPFVIDTSCVFNMTGVRNHKSKLSMLSKKFLKEDIQKSQRGHCSVEDSRACMKLTQLKLANGIDYGDAVLLGRKSAEKKRMEKESNAPACVEESYASNTFSQSQHIQKDAVVVTLPEKMSDYQNSITNADIISNSATDDEKSRLKCLQGVSNEAVVEQTCQIVLDHHFTLSHIVYPEVEEQSCEAMVGLDTMCQTLWQHTAVHGLFMILLGGKGSANGACFAAVKKKGFLLGSML